MNGKRTLKSQSANKSSSNPFSRVTRRTSLAVFAPIAGHKTLSKLLKGFQEVDPLTELGIQDKLEPLHNTLTNNIFNVELASKKFKDLIRVSHIICLEHSKVGKPKRYVDPGMIYDENTVPEKHLRQMKQFTHVVKIFIQFFFHSFKKSGKKPISKTLKQDMVNFIDSFCEMYEEGHLPLEKFHLSSLFRNLTKRFCDVQFDTFAREQHIEEEEFTHYEADDIELAEEILQSIKTLLGFLHLSVIVHSIEEMRSKLKLGIEHLTKDIHDGGWKIHVTLDDRVIEVRHTRREAVLKQQGHGDKNYWEIEYNVTMTFDSMMTSFQAVRLALTNLAFGEDVDDDVRNEIESKFFKGNFIVC